MVRFNNAVVEILAESAEVDDAGDVITEWSKVEEIKGDVQPHTLTEDEIKAFGLSTVKGNVRLFLYNGYHENIKSGNRASVLSSFTGKAELFNIMPINAWSKHGECLLVPVENEAEEEPTPEPTPDDSEGGEDGEGL
jgi:head-tail adaptor